MAARSNHGIALAAVAILAGGLIGCSEILPLAELPNITRLPEKLLSKEQQKEVVNTMAEEAQAHQAEAAKEIEKAQ